MEGEINFAEAFKKAEVEEKERKEEKKRTFASDIIGQVEDEEKKSFIFAKDEIKDKNKDSKKEKEVSKEVKVDKSTIFCSNNKSLDNKEKIKGKNDKKIESYEKNPYEKEAKKKKSQVLHKEFTIKPIQILKLFSFLFIISGIFLLGHYSDNIFDSLSYTGAAVNEIIPEDSAILEDDGLDQIEIVEPEIIEEEEIPIGEEIIDPLPTQEVIEEVIEVVEETPVEEEEEAIITEYTSVTISLNGIETDWHETWGKITDISYTIINGEVGKIKPEYFIMRVQGYDDIEKRITLPLAAKNINSGQIYSSSIIVPNGFAYNPTTLGDLSSVPIGVIAYDANDKVIGGDTVMFSLQEN
jgi:hypothetical protein